MFHALHVLLYCQFVCHVKCDLVCGYINVRNGLNTNLALMHHSIAYHYKTLCPLLRSLLPYFFLLNIIIFIYVTMITKKDLKLIQNHFHWSSCLVVCSSCRRKPLEEIIVTYFSLGDLMHIHYSDVHCKNI